MFCSGSILQSFISFSSSQGQMISAGSKPNNGIKDYIFQISLAMDFNSDVLENNNGISKALKKNRSYNPMMIIRPFDCFTEFTESKTNRL